MSVSYACGASAAGVGTLSCVGRGNRCVEADRRICIGLVHRCNLQAGLARLPSRLGGVLLEQELPLSHLGPHRGRITRSVGLRWRLRVRKRSRDGTEETKHKKETTKSPPEQAKKVSGNPARLRVTLWGQRSRSREVCDAKVLFHSSDSDSVSRSVLPPVQGGQYHRPEWTRRNRRRDGNPLSWRTR